MVTIFSLVFLHTPTLFLLHSPKNLLFLSIIIPVRKLIHFFVLTATTPRHQQCCYYTQQTDFDNTLLHSLLPRISFVYITLARVDFSTLAICSYRINSFYLIAFSVNFALSKLFIIFQFRPDFVPVDSFFSCLLCNGFINAKRFDAFK